jgi:hypothetical protein
MTETNPRRPVTSPNGETKKVEYRPMLNGETTAPKMAPVVAHVCSGNERLEIYQAVMGSTARRFSSSKFTGAL